MTVWDVQSSVPVLVELIQPAGSAGANTPSKSSLGGNVPVWPDETVSVALAASSLLPRSVCSAPSAIVFAYRPALAAVTSTLTVHVAPPGICVPADTVMVDSPATASSEPAAQSVAAFGAAAITRPAGRLSTNAAPSVAVPGCAWLPSVIVSVLVLPAGIALGENASASPGGARPAARNCRLSISSPPSSTPLNATWSIGVVLTMPRKTELSRLSPASSVMVPSELPAPSNASTSTT